MVGPALFVLTTCLAVAGRALAQPELADVSVENPVLNGRDFDAELTFAWPLSPPPSGALL